MRSKLHRLAVLERDHEQALRSAAEASEDAAGLRVALMERDQAAAGRDAREAALVQAKETLKKRNAVLEERVLEAEQRSRELLAQVGGWGSGMVIADDQPAQLSGYLPLYLRQAKGLCNTQRSSLKTPVPFTRLWWS
jgi:hypothetical protein